jgi:hypothetical protein
MFDNDGQLAPPSTEALGAALIIFCLLGVGFDIYRWIAHHRVPSLAVIYIPMFAMRFLRRAFFVDEPSVRIPPSWSWGLAVYYVAIGAVAVVEWGTAPVDRWFVAFALFNCGAVCFRAVVDRRAAEAAGQSSAA